MINHQEMGKEKKIKQQNYLGTRDSEGETPDPSFSAPSILLEHSTLLEIPSWEQNPVRYTPIDG